MLIPVRNCRTEASSGPLAPDLSTARHTHLIVTIITRSPILHFSYTQGKSDACGCHDAEGARWRKVQPNSHLLTPAGGRTSISHLDSLLGRAWCAIDYRLCCSVRRYCLGDDVEAAEGRRSHVEESSIDEIRRDPDGYRDRISARYDAEASEWVKQEMRRRIDLDRRKRRQSLRQRLLGKLSFHDRAA